MGGRRGVTPAHMHVSSSIHCSHACILLHTLLTCMYPPPYTYTAHILIAAQGKIKKMYTYTNVYIYKCVRGRRGVARANISLIAARTRAV